MSCLRMAGKPTSAHYISTPYIELKAYQSNDDATLLSACYEGDNDVVKFMLDVRKTDVNTKKADGFTALMVACIGGALEAVKILLSHNANVHAVTESGETALLLASFRGDGSVVRVLLEHQADVDAKKKDGFTALMVASLEGHLDVVNLLLDHNAEINACSTSNETALFAACFKGHWEVVRILLGRHANVDTKKTDGYTALMAASQEGHVLVVKLLLQHQADANARSRNGETARSVACRRGHSDVVSVLLEHQGHARNLAKPCEAETSISPQAVSSAGSQTLDLCTCDSKQTQGEVFLELATESDAAECAAVEQTPTEDTESPDSFTVDLPESNGHLALKDVFDRVERINTRADRNECRPINIQLNINIEKAKNLAFGDINITNKDAPEDDNGSCNSSDEDDNDNDSASSRGDVDDSG